MGSASNQESESAVITAASSFPLLTGMETLQSDADSHSAIVVADPCVCIDTSASWEPNLMDFCDARIQSTLHSSDAEVHMPMCFSQTIEFGISEVLSVAPRPACFQQAVVVGAMNPTDMHCRSSSLLASSLEHSEMQANYGDTHEKLSPVFCVPEKDTLQSKLAFMQSFMYSLLPELKRIHSQPPPFSLEEKFSAVRLAADTSLAISATGNSQWSQALLQHLATLSRSKVRVRGKDGGRKSSVLRRKIYAKILRRSSARGSVGLICHQAGSRHREGSNPCVCSRTVVKDYHSVKSHVGRRISPHLPRAKSVRLKRSGLSSYVKALRKSMAPKNMMKMRPSTVPCSAALVTKKHIASLSRLVPGGCSMDVPLLFEEAADYIRSLQMQVEALQCLSHLITL